MQFESRITWEKLSLELDLLNREAPRSIVPLLIGVNSVLWPNEDHEWSFRRLNFMGYELAAQTKDLSESERLSGLNDFFFEQQAFQITVSPEQATEKDLLLRPLLQQKGGSVFTLALVYMHLAAQIDLPIHLIHLPGICILKWVRGGKSSFINLSQGGQLLSETELLETVQARSTSSLDQDIQGLEVVSQKKLFLCYLKRLADIYEQEHSNNMLHIVYNMALKIEPSSTYYLHRRALLRKDLGLVKEALADLKRYFSFTDQTQAPADIKMAYCELQALTDAPSSGDHGLLH